MISSVKLEFETARMDDAVCILHSIAKIDPKSVESFLSMNEELCEIEACGSYFSIVPSKALDTFIDWNRNKLQ